jgi:hypothetical protein
VPSLRTGQRDGLALQLGAIGDEYRRSQGWPVAAVSGR